MLFLQDTTRSGLFYHLLPKPKLNKVLAEMTFQKDLREKRCFRGFTEVNEVLAQV